MMKMEQYPEPNLIQRIVQRLRDLLEIHLIARLRRLLEQRFIARMRMLLVKKDVELVEIVTGGIGASWGLWLLMPWTTFGSSPSFRAMASTAPEWLWGIVILIAGGLQLAGLGRDHFKMRRAGALAMAAVWVFVSTMIGIASPTSTGVIVYPWLAMASFWSYWRIRLVR